MTAIAIITRAAVNSRHPQMLLYTRNRQISVRQQPYRDKKSVFRSLWLHFTKVSSILRKSKRRADLLRHQELGTCGLEICLAARPQLWSWRR